MKSAYFDENPGAFNFMVQPFPIHFDCNDLHVIVFFDGHPEYESIEAMIQEREGSAPYVRAIITRLDKTQIDHINDREVVEWLKSRKRRRAVYYAPINCSLSEKAGKTRIVLRFTSYKGEDVVLDSNPASKTSARYAGLIDPKGHSKYISLPVMYSEKVALIGPESRVLINGTEYKIPVKVWIPLLFKGMKGYQSEIFYIGVIRTGDELASLLQAPEKMEPGGQWIYKVGNDISVYKITGTDGRNITVKGNNDEIVMEITDEGVALKTITVYSSCKCSKAEFSILFNPGIIVRPAAGNVYVKKISSFSISINGKNSLIAGTVETSTACGTVNILLKPVQPEWAVERCVNITVRALDRRFSVNTEILEDRT